MGTILSVSSFTIVSMVISVISSLYLIVNIFLNILARHRFIKSCIEHRKKALDLVLEKLKDDKYRLTDADLESIRVLFKEEIYQMKDNQFKTIMRKNFERKNRNNQERYAIEIFSDSNLIKAIA
jgi:hypothetical protein